jgi:hypothetical protein
MSKSLFPVFSLLKKLPVRGLAALGFALAALGFSGCSTGIKIDAPDASHAIAQIFVADNTRVKVAGAREIISGALESHGFRVTPVDEGVAYKDRYMVFYSANITWSTLPPTLGHAEIRIRKNGRQVGSARYNRPMFPSNNSTEEILQRMMEEFLKTVSPAPNGNPDDKTPLVLISGPSVAPATAAAGTTGTSAQAAGGTAPPVDNEDIKTLTASAKNGDAAAQYRLARRYYYAVGVKRNYKLAGNYFSKSAIGGNEAALKELSDAVQAGHIHGKILDNTLAVLKKQKAEQEK